MKTERIHLTPTETPNEKRAPLMVRRKPCAKGKHEPIVPEHPEQHPRFHGILTLSTKKEVRQFAKCEKCGNNITRKAETEDQLGDWELK